MSHEFETGFAADGKGSWHGLAKTLDAPPTPAVAIVEAGLDWKVVESPLYMPAIGDTLDDEGSPILGPTGVALGDDRIILVGGRECPRFKALRRSDNGYLLSVVGNGYHPLQNRLAFEFLAPFIADGRLEIVTAASLCKGRRVFVCAEIVGRAADIGGNGDEVKGYLVVYNGHDGSLAIGVMFTPIRTICDNTLHYGIEASTAHLKIRHTAGAKDALAVVQDAIDLSAKSFEVSVEQFRAMRRDIDEATFRQYVKDVLTPERKLAAAARLIANLEVEVAEAIPGTKDHAEASDRLAEAIDERDRMPRAYDDLVRLFEEGKGSDLAGKTVWGAYNAVTEYVDHERGRDSESSLNSSWFGEGAKVRKRAHEKALVLVK